MIIILLTAACLGLGLAIAYKLKTKKSCKCGKTGKCDISTCDINTTDVSQHIISVVHSGEISNEQLIDVPTEAHIEAPKEIINPVIKKAKKTPSKKDRQKVDKVNKPRKK